MIVCAEQVFHRRRRWRGFAQGEVDRTIAVADRRPDYPSPVPPDQLFDIGLAIGSFRLELTAERRFRIDLEDWEIEAVLVVHHDRFVICEQFGKQAENEQDDKYPG